VVATVSRPLSSRDKVLGGLLRQVRPFDLTQFSERLAFQKTAYLLQAFGFYLGFRYTWYLYGPYSPDLAKVGLKITGTASSIPDVTFSRTEAQTRFKEFLAFIASAKDDPQQLELLASIHFLRKINPQLSEDEIIKRMQEKQSYFTQERAEEGWNYLKTKGLI
jgi:uncharacterized protein YwgA